MLLKEFMAEEGKTQAQIATQLNCTQSLVSLWLSGKVAITAGRAAQINEAFPKVSELEALYTGREAEYRRAQSRQAKQPQAPAAEAQ